MRRWATRPVLPAPAVRKFSREVRCRHDLICFGQFEKEYSLRNDNLTMNKDNSRRLYPIPMSENTLNSKLVQNPGH